MSPDGGNPEHKDEQNPTLLFPLFRALSVPQESRVKNWFGERENDRRALKPAKEKVSWRSPRHLQATMLNHSFFFWFVHNSKICKFSTIIKQLISSATGAFANIGWQICRKSLACMCQGLGIQQKKGLQKLTLTKLNATPTWCGLARLMNPSLCCLFTHPLPVEQSADAGAVGNVHLLRLEHVLQQGQPVSEATTPFQLPIVLVLKRERYLICRIDLSKLASKFEVG